MGSIPPRGGHQRMGETPPGGGGRLVAWGIAVSLAPFLVLILAVLFGLT